jgi:uncharacterized membrane protein YkvI
MMWQRYFLPAFTFMSVVIGGGYATGRELVEFFMPAGPKGGLLAMLVTAAVWSIMFGLSLAVACATRSYDYRAFFQQLLGRGWILFEIVYLLLLILVLAVLGAASGAIGAGMFAAPEWVGAVAFLSLVGLFIWLGGSAIERLFSFWGLAMIVAYLAVLAMCMIHFGDRIESVFSAGQQPAPGWLVGGLKYAGYNIVIAPALLGCARYHRGPAEAFAAGALAGPVAILPGVLFYIAMHAAYPAIQDAPIPLTLLLKHLDTPWLALIMHIIVFGTLVQTGVGVLHGLNERLLGGETRVADSKNRFMRLAVSAAASLIAVALATSIGLVDLIAKGYGYLAWIILVVYALPLLSVGVWRIRRSQALQASAAGSGMAA